MRRKLVIAVAAIAALAFAGIAIAASTQKNQATIKFAKLTKAGGTTVIDSTFKVSDPGNTTPGKVGKPTRQIRVVTINFPKGMKFNYHVLPTCAATALAQIKAQCGKAKLATGTTDIDGRGSFLGQAHGKLTAYNAVNGLRIITEFGPGKTLANTVLSPSLKGTKLVTTLPGALKTIDAYLTNFHLVIGVHSKKIKGKKTYYATLPKTCPKGGFKTTVKYDFYDGGTFTTPAVKNKCKK